VGRYLHHREERYDRSSEAKATCELVLVYVRVTRKHVRTRSTNCPSLDLKARDSLLQILIAIHFGRVGRCET
jgi:hypothetical protein